MDGENKDRTRDRFGESLTAHRGRVFAWVLVRVGSDRPLAEDVTQECLVRVWETRVHNPPPSGALYTYLLITARNLLRDRFRRQAPSPVFGWEENHVPDKQTPENQFVLRETVERLAAEMALMPYLLRETLRLRVEEELDYPTIAARMNCPVGTVKSRISTARMRLGTVLEAQETLTPLITQSLRVTKQRTVSSPRRGIITSYKEQKTVTTSTEINRLHSQIQAMEARLSALESRGSVPKDEQTDPWEAPQRRFAQNLTRGRQSKGSVFALGFHYVLAQSSEEGVEGSASVQHTFEHAGSLPDDRQLTQRLERMRHLTSDLAILCVFRYFYALRFAGKAMRATANELAAATATNEERITTLLKPLVADRTLLLVRAGDNGETYEWEGNDIAITTLLLTSP